MQAITWALQKAETEIRQAVQGMTGDGWTSVYDEDGNLDVPSTERSVLVFLCGDRERSDYRPDDAGYGLRLGYWDTEKLYWRVSGKPERYVTHWRECPADPVREEQP